MMRYRKSISRLTYPRFDYFHVLQTGDPKNVVLFKGASYLTKMIAREAANEKFKVARYRGKYYILYMYFIIILFCVSLSLCAFSRSSIPCIEHSRYGIGASTPWPLAFTKIIHNRAKENSVVVFRCI